MRSYRRSCSIVGIAASIAVLGCAADNDAAGRGEVSTLVLDPDVAIGLVDGDSAYLFGSIVSVAVDDVGHTYVGDRIGATIRAYDGAGRYLERIARAGGGPGEINGWPAHIAVGPDARIHVRDGSRVTIFAAIQAGGVADSVDTIWPVPNGNLTSARSRVGAGGTYFYPSGLFRTDELPRFFYLPLEGGTHTGDTLEVPTYPGIVGRRRALYRLGRDGRLVEGLSHVPFAPLPVWDVTLAGTILSSSGSEDRLVETDMGGDTLRLIGIPAVERATIPTAERLDSARALDARLDSLPVPLDQVIGLGEGVQDRRLPSTLPSIVGLHVADNGSIWIERWPPEGGQQRFYDVLDGDGQFTRRVVLRAALLSDPSPYFGRNHVVGVTRDADTGVERVVRFTVAVPPAAR